MKGILHLMSHMTLCVVRRKWLFQCNRKQPFSYAILRLAEQSRTSKKCIPCWQNISRRGTWNYYSGMKKTANETSFNWFCSLLFWFSRFQHLLMQENFDIYFYPRAFLFLWCNLSEKELSGVHQASKYYIILLWYAEYAVCGLLPPICRWGQRRKPGRSCRRLNIRNRKTVFHIGTSWSSNGGVWKSELPWTGNSFRTSRLLHGMLFHRVLW